MNVPCVPKAQPGSIRHRQVKEGVRVDNAHSQNVCLESSTVNPLHRKGIRVCFHSRFVKVKLVMMTSAVREWLADGCGHLHKLSADACGTSDLQYQMFGAAHDTCEKGFVWSIAAIRMSVNPAHIHSNSNTTIQGVGNLQYSYRVPGFVN